MLINNPVMRILVIEDEERVALLIKRGLEEMGFSITIVTLLISGSIFSL
jgi:DNA-binding response OmpR family regulator